MKIYKTSKGIIIHHDGNFFLKQSNWNAFINRPKLFQKITKEIKKLVPDDSLSDSISNDLVAPMGSKEIWASGVTYLRSREARMEESKDAGGGDFYARVYDAERPELFFKATSYRTVGSGDKVRIRKDSKWNVPEPELTLFINSKGKIQGYTVGNDMSSRDIEGENPLYLPQAKTYERSAALGPCLYIPEHEISLDTTISINIKRNGLDAFTGSIQLNRMKRKFTELAEYLFRE